MDVAKLLAIFIGCARDTAAGDTSSQLLKCHKQQLPTDRMQSTRYAYWNRWAGFLRDSLGSRTTIGNVPSTACSHLVREFNFA